MMTLCQINTRLNVPRFPPFGALYQMNLISVFWVVVDDGGRGFSPMKIYSSPISSLRTNSRNLWPEVTEKKDLFPSYTKSPGFPEFYSALRRRRPKQIFFERNQHQCLSCLWHSEFVGFCRIIIFRWFLCSPDVICRTHWSVLFFHRIMYQFCLYSFGWVDSNGKISGFLNPMQQIN